ncbi:MBL fold metallo-hydrolase [Devosia sp. XJ19-1]|uniref:MBL fold metallo-hydrolase n=1 Tax=Devosia ureilytica TaxID=2952754 RepID=A0A9Q4FV24_9HYPH|nr:MBL fold metallo-hydrolase [Devosia ureilytica]MCP8885339.1 MBL fold metallo-hydrolase [Devosia ureilytica]MCP8888985.1 MBL fold metallo-hydrolase [Devosia ureilytica]
MSNSTPNPSRRKLLGALALAPAALALPSLLRLSPTRAETNPDPFSGHAAAIRHRIGEIEIIALADGRGPITNDLIIGFNDTAGRLAAKAAHKAHDPVTSTISINAYLIRTADRLIAVDSGAGAAMGPTTGAWLDSLASAGIAKENIDTLFLTHTHLDHVGGMSNEGGIRLLPNAQLVAAEAEWAFAHDDGVLSALPEAFKGMMLASRAQLAPYAANRAMLAMDQETEFAPGVTAVPLPGHTPGHMGLRIESHGEALLIWGDVVHVPAYQFTHPDWSVAFDADGPTAIASRRRMLDMASHDDLLVAGMHLDFPALGYVERRGDAYRYFAAPPDFRV